MIKKFDNKISSLKMKKKGYKSKIKNLKISITNIDKEIYNVKIKKAKYKIEKDGMKSRTFNVEVEIVNDMFYKSSEFKVQGKNISLYKFTDLVEKLPDKIMLIFKINAFYEYIGHGDGPEYNEKSLMFISKALFMKYSVEGDHYKIFNKSNKISLSDNSDY